MPIKMPKFSRPVGASAAANGSTAKKLKANEPLNRVFTGIKNAGNQAKEAYRGEVPLTTPFRNGKAISDMRTSGEGAAYNWGDKSLSWKKIGAATAGAYVAGDTVHRGVTGGSLTRNNEGQRDILGVPII